MGREVENLTSEGRRGDGRKYRCTSLEGLSSWYNVGLLEEYRWTGG